jgi:hypothetical protein
MRALAAQVVTAGKTWDPLDLRAPLHHLMGIGPELAKKLANLSAVLGEQLPNLGDMLREDLAQHLPDLTDELREKLAQQLPVRQGPVLASSSLTTPGSAAGGLTWLQRSCVLSLPTTCCRKRHVGTVDVKACGCRQGAPTGVPVGIACGRLKVDVVAGAGGLGGAEVQRGAAKGSGRQQGIHNGEPGRGF